MTPPSPRRCLPPAPRTYECYPTWYVDFTGLIKLRMLTCTIFLAGPGELHVTLFS